MTIKEFGAFVEFLPGKDGLVHIQRELANFRVKQTEDIVKMGDEIWVKCLGVDEKGRVKLSRRAAMAERDKEMGGLGRVFGERRRRARLTQSRRPQALSNRSFISRAAWKRAAFFILICNSGKQFAYYPDSEPVIPWQEPTHTLAGVIIQKCFVWRRFRAVGLVVTAVIAFLSHGLLDKLANLTYHPVQYADFRQCRGELSFGGSIFIIVFLCIWWRRYWVGIWFAMLPDLDWVFIHGQEILHSDSVLPTSPHAYLLHWIYAQIPGASFLDRLPKYRGRIRKGRSGK